MLSSIFFLLDFYNCVEIILWKSIEYPKYAPELRNSPFPKRGKLKNIEIKPIPIPPIPIYYCFDNDFS